MHQNLPHESLNTLSEAIEHKFIAILPNISAGIIIFIAFLILATIARFLVRRICRTLTSYTPLVDLAEKISYIGLIILGCVTALGTGGVNVSALVASLGLFGFTLGFAFKDLLSNTLAGVMILFYRPFKIGDKISGKEFDGQVHEINLRYTILSNHDHRILIPNASMLNNIVNVYNSSEG